MENISKRKKSNRYFQNSSVYIFNSSDLVICNFKKEDLIFLNLKIGDVLEILEETNGNLILNNI